MELTTLWFILIAVLYTGYFVLEGFDFGVGILLPLLAKSDRDRRGIINTVGPHWDGNEVWLITAGGATFAAFPHWYATLFSGFYLPLFLILIALIIRGVAFEFRSKNENPAWRSFWDWAIFTGSLIPSILWGVAFANFLRGVPIDAGKNYVGGFWNLLNAYSLLGGLVTFMLFTLQGALFLTLKTTGNIENQARKAAGRLWIPALILLAGLMVTSIYVRSGSGLAAALPVSVIAVLVLLAAGVLTGKKREGWAFTASSLSILFFAAAMFLSLFPRLMVSSLDAGWSLTVTNSSSSPYTLGVMTTVALIFLPIVLIYQGWTYWVFRKRINPEKDRLTY